MHPKTDKVVFFGTPEFAVQTLQNIHDSGRTVSLVVTQPDKIGGRGNQLLQPAVKIRAQALGIPVVQPVKIKNKEFLELLASQKADIFAVAAYGRILQQSVIDMPSYILNVHASLLPRWRGAAPIARAILAGDKSAGVSIMKIVKELDAGDYMLQKSVNVDETKTTGELTVELANLGAQAMIEALDTIDRGEEVFVKQDESLVTYAPPIEKEEARLRWDQPAAQVHDHIRGMQPAPGAYSLDGNVRIKIHRSQKTDQKVNADQPPGTLKAGDGKLFVATKDEWLEIVELQKEGKSRQSAVSFLQGYKVQGQQWV